MNHQEYWAKREEEALKHYITEEAEYDKEIKRIYADMLDSCNEQINAFYGKYAANENITLAEAKKRVSKLDIAAYERKAERYVKDREFSTQANKEMRLYNATMRINRLEMLKANIGLELIAGHDALDKFMGGILKGRTEAELKRQAGILGKTITNNAEAAHAIVNASFHNATFSDRVWMYQDLMKAELSKLLQSGLIAGKNPRTLARELTKKFGTSTYNAERLMRTELARVQTEAQKQSFERNGFTEYSYLANTNCCDACQALDGKHFKVADMMPGENAAPLHPNCRCSVAAYSDRKEYDEWLEYLENGGTTEEWNKLKDSRQFLKAYYPSGYKDDRNIGTKITEQQLTNFADKAKKNGIQIGNANNANDYGGFENFQGDYNLLMDTLDGLIEAKKLLPINKNVILTYDYVKDSVGRVDVDAFAMTDGRKIILNKHLFDSVDLKTIYAAEVADHFFVEGSTYKNISIHEYGHVLENMNKRLNDKVVDILEEMAYTEGEKITDYLKNKISGYAVRYNGFKYSEVVAELYSMLFTENNAFALDVFRKAGLDL